MTTNHNLSPPDESRPTEASREESPRNHHGSLRSKLVLSLAGMFLVFLFVDELVRHRVIKPEFAALERAGAIRDANRVQSAVIAQIENLSGLAKHWASQLEHQPATLRSDHHDHGNSSERRPYVFEWAAILPSDEGWRWLQAPHSDPSAEHRNDKFTQLEEFCRKSKLRSIGGMVRLADDSLVMFSSVAINVPEDKSVLEVRESQATKQRNHQHLVLGRTIDEAMLASIRAQTQVEFTLRPLGTETSPPTAAVWEADDSVLVVEFPLVGLNSQQLANVHVEVPRDITAHTKHTNSVARNSFIIGAAAALLLLLLLLQYIVIGPLTAIREHSDRVAEHGFDTEPLVLSGNDEIGELAGAFDHMMRRLGDAQEQLAEASAAAGRSQVASTVIHNVGNVLTNVNSLLDVANERVEGLRIHPLSQLAGRFRQHNGVEALIEATPDYLEGLAASLDSDRATISELISTLQDNVRHIHDVIRDQQRHTGYTAEPTSIKLRDVIEEAIGCCRARLDQDSVQVNVSGCLDVDIRSDRSLLLQSVINIVGNARHALREKGDDGRMLSIEAEMQKDSVTVRFRDNGIGMSCETLAKVFDAHFTTRKTGSGLGLHFCANTLRRLGGSIHAESEGKGCGSTFVLELPLASASSKTMPLVVVDHSADSTCLGAEA